MIGIDTNVVIRFLVQDHPAHSRRATALFASLTPQMPGFISLLTLAEVVWVLRSNYKVGRVAIATMIEEMLISNDIMFEYQDIMPLLIHDYKKGRADFSDYAIAALNQRHGCKKTVTFDRVAGNASLMELLS